MAYGAKRQLDEKQRGRVVALFRSGIGVRALVERFGVSANVVTAALRESGIDVQATTRAREKVTGKL